MCFLMNSLGQVHVVELYPEHGRQDMEALKTCRKVLPMAVNGYVLEIK